MRDKKDEIIGCIHLLKFYYVREWDYTDSQKFCKDILDKENIEYSDSDFKTSNCGCMDLKVLGLVGQYARKYVEDYFDEDPIKTGIMQKICYHCKALAQTQQEFSDFFSSAFKEDKPKPEVTIRKGESIRFNGGLNGLSTEEIESLVKISLDDEKPKSK